MFLWRIPIPPSRASAIARAASDTVSIAAETRGMLSTMLRESFVVTSASRGRTADARGTSMTSSNVTPAPRNFFTVITSESLGVCRDSRDILSDNQRMHLVGALVRFYRLEICHVPHDGILIKNPVGAKNPAGHARNFQRMIHVVPLRHRHLLEPQLSLILQSSKLEAQKLRFRNFRGHVHELLLRHLE